MKKVILIFCVSILVLSLAGVASAQQRGYQGGQDQPQQYGAQQYGTQQQMDQQRWGQQQQRQQDQQRWDQQQQQRQQDQQRWGQQQQRQQDQQRQQRTGQRGQQQTAGNFQRASDLLDMKVQGQQGERLGNVDDIIITRDGQVAYVIVSRGGIMGIGGDHVPVPFQNAQIMPEQDALVLRNVDEQTLENAPTIGRDDLQRLEDPGFERQVFSYYGRQQQQQMQQPGMQQQQPYQQQQRQREQQQRGQTR